MFAMACRSMSSLTVEEVEEYLETNGITDGVVNNFSKNLVNGAAFLQLSEECVATCDWGVVFCSRNTHCFALHM